MPSRRASSRQRVRAHGGILDGSKLGKIEVAGSDAARYLNRLYLTLELLIDLLL